jgi:hypothetical protein
MTEILGLLASHPLNKCGVQVRVSKVGAPESVDEKRSQAGRHPRVPSIIFVTSVSDACRDSDGGAKGLYVSRTTSIASRMIGTSFESWSSAPHSCSHRTAA